MKGRVTGRRETKTDRQIFHLLVHAQIAATHRAAPDPGQELGASAGLPCESKVQGMDHLPLLFHSRAAIWNADTVGMP